MNKAQLAEMLAELDPAELRALRYEVSGGHKCTNSSTLYHCCGEQRCEACHVPHLKEMHSTPELYAYEKFINTWKLTWQGYVPPKQAKKVNEKPARRATRATGPAPKVIINPLAGVNDDNIDEVLALLAEKLGRTL